MGLLQQLSKRGRQLVEEFAWVARQHAGKWMSRFPDDDRDEVESAAMYGLVLGAGSYDPDRSDNPEGWIARRIAGTLQDLVARKRGEWGDNRKISPNDTPPQRVDGTTPIDIVRKMEDRREQFLPSLPFGLGRCKELLRLRWRVVWDACMLVQPDTCHVVRWQTPKRWKWAIDDCGIELVRQSLAVKEMRGGEPVAIELPKKPTLTLDEVAQSLRMDKGAVMRAVHRGDLPAPVKIGGFFLIEREALSKALEAKRVTPRKAKTPAPIGSPSGEG